MKIKLLGTGAADGIPGFYSDTQVSIHAREHGGKDLRTRTAALLDGCIKIDLGPDSHAQIQNHRLDPREWDAVVFTHSHDDHFSITELQYFLFPFNPQVAMPMPVYANSSICDRIELHYPHWPYELHRTYSFRPYDLGDYRVTPIRAHHMDDEDAHNIFFQKDGKTLLYGSDTGIWLEPTWEFLQGWKIDLLVLECTDGIVPSGYDGHLSIETMDLVLNRLHKIGCLDSLSQVVTTHHSQNGGATHDELCQILEPKGVTVGYDGIELDV